MSDAPPRLDVYRELYRLEYEHHQNITSNLHAQWGYATALATGVWLLLDEALSPPANPPLAAGMQVTLGFLAWLAVAVACSYMVRAHLRAAAFVQLGTLKEWEEFRKSNFEDAASTPAGDPLAESFEDYLCAYIAEARDQTAELNEARGALLWKARTAKVFALCLLAAIGVVEIIVRIYS